jgi:DUF4097 and DUF4098 domain-containing protein YvlB
MARSGVATTLLGPLLWVALLLLFAGGEAHGAVEREEFEVEPGGRLVVDAPRGSVRVHAVRYDSAEPALVTVEIRRFGLSPMLRFTTRQDGNDVIVEGRRLPVLRWLPPWSWRRVRIDVSVPEQFDVDIATRGGGVEVDGVSGQVEARARGGKLRFREVTGPIDGRTSGGPIEVDDCNGSIELRTAGGSIDVDRVDGDVRARSSSGSINLVEVDGDIEARTSGGSIAAIDVTGELIATTSGGGIRARFEGAPAGELETSGGSIDVAFPPDVGADLDARSLGGRVQIEHDAILSGGELLRLRTLGGHIRVHES